MKKFFVLALVLIQALALSVEASDGKRGRGRHPKRPRTEETEPSSAKQARVDGVACTICQDTAQPENTSAYSARCRHQ